MPQDYLSHRFCVAPMLDWTDRHCRYFFRSLSQHARLYTEMVTAAAIIHGDHHRLLRFSAIEHPIALQLGGSDPAQLAQAIQIALPYGYDEFNLNVGCPSDRVQSGAFGACLMKSKVTVAECFKAMQDACDQLVTIKCRTGVDNFDHLDLLLAFIETVANAGCTTFIIHARKAWLKGLSPKQNREIPPLEYDKVYAIKAQFPELCIVINGGIQSLMESENHLDQVDGVMLGRAAYQNPYLLAEVDQILFNTEKPIPSRLDAIRTVLDYIQAELAVGVKLNSISKSLLGLYNGQKGAKSFRRHISENAHLQGADESVIIEALQYVESI